MRMELRCEGGQTMNHLRHHQHHHHHHQQQQQQQQDLLLSVTLLSGSGWTLCEPGSLSEPSLALPFGLPGGVARLIDKGGQHAAA